MWIIYVTEDLIKKLKRRGIYKQAMKVLNDLKIMLKNDPNRTINILHRNPIVFSIGDYPVRRYRVGLGKYRLFYIILPEKKSIVFFDVKPRRKAY